MYLIHILLWIHNKIFLESIEQLRKNSELNQFEFHNLVWH